MNKFKFIFLLAVIFFINNNAYAEKNKNNYIGIVDFNALVLLHPKMANFDISSGQYIIKKDTEQLSQEEKDELSNTRKRINDLQNKLNKLYDDFDSEQIKNKYEYQNTIKDVIATATLVQEAEKLNQKQYYSKHRFEKESQNLSTQIAALCNEMDLIKEKSKETFSDNNEKEIIITQIKKEIKQTIKQVADKHKINIVLNSSKKRLANNYKDRIHNNSIPIINYSSIINAGPYKSLNNQKNEKEEKDYYYSLTDLTKDWLKYEIEFLYTYRNHIPDSDIIKGAQNLSKEVLSLIYQNYKINPKITEAIINANLF